MFLSCKKNFKNSLKKKKRKKEKKKATNGDKIHMYYFN